MSEERLRDDVDGSITRFCTECGTAVTVQRPHRSIGGQHNTRKQRELFAKEIRHQILWEALCSVCVGWWWDLLEKITPGIAPKRNADTSHRRQ
jgi:hypothetical protein